MKKFQIKKSIRFKLEPEKTDLLDAKIRNLKHADVNNNELPQLVNIGFQVIKNFKDYVIPNDNLSSRITIDHQWLNTFARSLYYEWKNKKDNQTRSKFSNPNKIELPNIKYIYYQLVSVIDNWNEILNELHRKLEENEEWLSRKSEIALLIKKFGLKSNFNFVREFVKESKHKDSDALRDKLLAEITQLEGLLIKCNDYYLPSQTNGIVLAKASFNYYTINKKKKDFNRELEIVKNKLNNSFDINDINLLRVLKKESWRDLSLKDLYTTIKEYKSTEKARFNNEAKNIRFDELTTNFPLFSINQAGFNTFIDFTKRIISIADEISTSKNGSNIWKRLKEEQTKIKKERGKLYQYSFKNYIKLGELYKKVAEENGKQKARLKAIEKEKIDSQLLEYWSLIIEENNQHKLIIIPKQNAKNIYKKLRQYQYKPKSSDKVIYYIESMTYRALKKLCFGINNDEFRSEIKNELNSYQYVSGEFVLKNNNNNDQELINFYKAVLNTEFVKKNLALPSEVFTTVINDNYDDLDSFKIALEKACYIRKTVVSDELLNLMMAQDAQIFSITSLDLRKKESLNLKNHTKIWLDFWSEKNEKEHFQTRLNPEISITWRKPKESRVEKYGKGTEKYDSKKKNRFLYPQFTLGASFTKHALSNEIITSFNSDNDKLQSINNFNKKFNEAALGKEIFVLGIDRGISELASLCLINRDINQKIRLVKIPVYTLKNINAKVDGKLVINNLSYYVDNKELFNIEEYSAFDLTSAKVIKGRIVQYGDIKSYLNLKMINARRRIAELYPNISATDEIIYDDKNQSFRFREENHNVIYYYFSKFSSLVSVENISLQLNNFLDDIRNKGFKEQKEQSIEKINHLRDAISANIVGILYHIYKKLKTEKNFGIIAMEDFDFSKLDGDFLRSNETLGRRLEFMLYRKFQNDFLVPPNLSLINNLREQHKRAKGKKRNHNDELLQIGLINYVDAENTSKICPNCNRIPEQYNSAKAGLAEKTKKERKAIYNKHKYDEARFSCNNDGCGFDTKNNRLAYDDLYDNDKVAAFNIAKRGIEQINHG